MSLGGVEPTVRTMIYVEPDEAELLNQELEMFGHDVIYEQALQMAACSRGAARPASAGVLSHECGRAGDRRLPGRGGGEPAGRRAVSARGPAGRGPLPHLHRGAIGRLDPKGLYRVLAQEPYRSQVPWELVHVFWGDERCVPPDHADSNYRLAYDALLSQVPLPETNIHRVPTEAGDCAEAAADYAQELVTFFHLERDALPRFDLVLLGVGDDGHTASLFPGKPALDERQALVVATPPGRLPPPVDRVTLTLPVLNAAAHVVFLVDRGGQG